MRLSGAGVIQKEEDKGQRGGDVLRIGGTTPFNSDILYLKGRNDLWKP
jgi:hypothetical protein